VTLLYVFQHHGIMFIKGTEFMMGMDKNWFFGIDPKAFGAVGALVNFSVAFIVAKATDPAPEHIQALVDNLRVPAGSGNASVH
jgi:cation/acetate symporter